MDRLIPLLFTGLDDAYERLRRRLEGLTDAEYLWEPVSGMWTVRATDDTWHADDSRDDPDPAPVTTIAWRLWHIGSVCLAEYCSPALGEWPLPVSKTEWFGTAAPAVDAVATAYAAFRERVTGLGEDGIRSQLGPAWGPYAESSWADLVVHALDEVAHHGAEVALLRDLYRHLG